LNVFVIGLEEILEKHKICDLKELDFLASLSYGS